MKLASVDGKYVIPAFSARFYFSLGATTSNLFASRGQFSRFVASLHASSKANAEVMFLSKIALEYQLLR